MTHMRPLARTDLEEFEPFFQIAEQMMGGFVPNSLFTMGRRPEILRAFMMLAGVINGPGTVDPGLKQLVAYVASNAAGCRYCQAHTSAHAAHAGVDAAKIEHAFEFETHAAFSDAERAALLLARDSALVPNLVGAEHFAALREHFDDAQIVELVAVSSLFGFLNRWNDTMSTPLEDCAARIRGGAPRCRRVEGREARLVTSRRTAALPRTPTTGRPARARDVGRDTLGPRGGAILRPRRVPWHPREEAKDRRRS